jgi:hypothetical protein
MSLLICKVLKHLLVYGAKSYEPDSAQMNYTKWCLCQVSVFRELRDAHRGHRDKLEKLTVLMMKTLNEFEEHVFASMAPILSDTVHLCVKFIIDNTIDSVDDSPLLIHCGNLLRSISRRFSNIKRSSSNANPTMNQCTEILLNVLSIETLEALLRHIVVYYLPPSRVELEEWVSDPEGYVTTEDCESFRYMLRPCIETLYVGLLYDFESVLSDLLLGLRREITAFDVRNTTERDILKLCAVLKALGLTASCPGSGGGLLNGLGEELLNFFRFPSEKYFVLQYHGLWLIGEALIPILPSHEQRAHLYSVVGAVLSEPNADLVLRVTACKVLRIALEADDFDGNLFRPFAKELLTAMIRLLVETAECDTKLLLLRVVSLAIVNGGKDLSAEHADVLVGYLPQLWDMSEEHNLLRGAVIDTLADLVQVFYLCSYRMSSFL